MITGRFRRTLRGNISGPHADGARLHKGHSERDANCLVGQRHGGFPNQQGASAEKRRCARTRMAVAYTVKQGAEV